MTSADRYSERPAVRDGIAETYREAAAAYETAERAYWDAFRAHNAAKKALTSEVEAVARWQVRRAHADWFHSNGNKRGAFRQQIEQALQASQRDVMRTLFPPTAQQRALERVLEQEEQAILADASAREEEKQGYDHWAERDAGMLAQENDPARRERYERARAREDALERDPRVQSRPHNKQQMPHAAHMQPSRGGLPTGREPQPTRRGSRLKSNSGWRMPRQSGGR